MARKIVWLGAIAFLVLLASFYGVAAFQKTFFLWNLKEETPAVIKEWHAKEAESGYFYPYAFFTYQVEGRVLEGASFYKKKYARNPYALEPALRQLAESSLVAYYNPSQPTLVSLEKDYPFKEGIKAFVALVLALYFFFLQKRSKRLA